MTNPAQPPPLPPPQLEYLSSSGYGKASVLINIAVILNYIAATVDALIFLGALSFSIFMGVFIASVPPTTGPAPPFPPAVFLIGMSIIFGIPILFAAIIKFIAAHRLRKNAQYAWGLGLTAGITGCAEIMFLCVSMSCFFVFVAWIPLGVGIYTLVVLCLENVRRYINDHHGVSGFEPLPPNFPNPHSPSS